jgi:hypothetical protein
MATLKDFAFATVMDVYVFVGGVPKTPVLADADFKLDSLTISNITQEGPVKEARGGIHGMPIIRHKKTIRLEMEDVVARLETLEHFFGAKVVKTDPESFTITDKFPKGLGLIGTTYVVDRDTGERIWMQLTFHDFLPDGVFEIGMEAEGDIGMISLAGELFPNDCGEYFTAKKIADPVCV